MRPMKKLLAVVVAVVMVLAMGVTAFAAGSPDGKNVQISGDVAGYAESSVKLDAPTAAGIIGNGTTAAQVAVVYNGDITTTKTPATLSFTVNNSAAPQKLYVFHYVNGAWKIEGSGDPKTVTITVDSASPFAVVVWSPAGTPAKPGTSPKTGETNAVAIVLASVLAAGAVAFVVAQKKRA